MFFVTDKIKVKFAEKTYFLYEASNQAGIKKLIFEPESAHCDIIAEIPTTFELMPIRVGSISISNNLIIDI